MQYARNIEPIIPTSFTTTNARGLKKSNLHATQKALIKKGDMNEGPILRE
jgi:hypothetical protein